MTDKNTQPTPKEITDLFRALLEERKEQRTEMKANIAKTEEIQKRYVELENKVKEIESQKAGVERRNIKLQERINELEALLQQPQPQKNDANKTLVAVEKHTDKVAGVVSSSIGKMVEHEVFAADVLADTFEKILGRKLSQRKHNVHFVDKNLSYAGEIDVLLGEGSTIVLIEVKTTLESAHVHTHIERLEKYRSYITATSPSATKKRILGAVAGLNVKGDAIKIAMKNGLYAVIHTDKGVEIAPPLKDFKPKEW